MPSEPTKMTKQVALAGYDGLFADVARVIEEARYAAARSVNTAMTATYGRVGRPIVEQEQAELLEEGASRRRKLSKFGAHGNPLAAWRATPTLEELRTGIRN